MSKEANEGRVAAPGSVAAIAVLVVLGACNRGSHDPANDQAASLASAVSAGSCTPPPGAACKDLSALSSSNSATVETFGVSADIFSVMQGLTVSPAPNAEVPLVALTPSKQLTFYQCPAIDFPFLSPSGAADLQKAAGAHDTNTILLNAAWRSIATLYVISNSPHKSSGVAKLGNDPHSVGVSIDLNPTDGGSAHNECDQWCGRPAKSGGCKTATGCDYQCVTEKLFGTNEALDLEANNFVYSALDSQTAFFNTCNDANHWNHKGDPNSALKHNAVEAFQLLWNFDHPCDPIAVDGDAGPATSEALADTPSCGFTYTSGPPSTGISGGGCQTATDSSAEAICCPDVADPSGYSCQTSCDADAGSDAGDDAEDSASTDSGGGDVAPLDAGSDSGPTADATLDATDSTVCGATMSCVIDFDSVNASAGLIQGPAVSAYLASFGVSVTAIGDAVVDIQQAPSWEPTSSPPNFLNMYGSSADLSTGVSYTLTLPGPMASVSFYRTGIDAGSTMGIWTATAYTSSNQVLSTVGESSIVTNVPPTQFVLTGPGIAYVTFFSNVESFAGTYLSIDDLTLNP
jgi:hypothetical protein